jgi:hypothetical protein
MVEEYTSIIKNDVWDIVPRLERKSTMSSKWLYKIKHVADGSIEKFKARFVARGFSQREGVNYEKTFAPVVEYTSIRAVMSLVSFMGWTIHQMDAKTTFLNGIIEEEVFTEQPRGFEVSGKNSHVCRLKKASYGLKQAPRASFSKIDRYPFMGWTIHQMDAKTTFLNGIIEEEVFTEQPRGFEVSGKNSHVCRLKKASYGLKQVPRASFSKIDRYPQGMGFTKSEENSNLYYMLLRLLLILVLYVDDLFLTGAEKLIAGCKADMVVDLKMKDIGMMHYFLVLEVGRD